MLALRGHALELFFVGAHTLACLSRMHALARAAAASRVASRSSSAAATVSLSALRQQARVAPPRRKPFTRTLAASASGAMDPPPAPAPSTFVGPGSEELRALCVGPCKR